MEPPKLFLKTLSELEEKLVSQDEYDLLALSRILRLLLDDGEPLVHQINRIHRRTLTFRCARSYLGQSPGGFQFDTISSQDGFDPETSVPGNQRVEVDLDGLLRETVAVHDGQRLSVLDVIKYEAHVGGGVHAGRPRTPSDQALHRLSSSMRVGGYTPTLRQLKAIGRVVLRALRELRRLVQEEYPYCD